MEANLSMQAGQFTPEDLIGVSGGGAREKLRKIFDVPVEQHGAGWDKLWQEGTFLPWDRGLPSPALIDAMNQRKTILGESKTDARRKKALVPGCGKGYDVLFLASLGYDTYGLDISPNALAACQKFAEENFASYEAQAASSNGSGKYSFVLGDFFADDWRSGSDGLDTFDIIYDYTFLCALPPSRRPAWAARMKELLTKDGKLICLEFPTFKDPHTAGPPFGLVPDTYLAHMNNPGKDISYSEAGVPEDRWTKETSGSILKRVDHWQPQRTHEVGKGSDWMSIWQHE